MAQNNTINEYEKNQHLSMYLEFHYGEKYFDIENFPKKCIDTLVNRIEVNFIDRALDIGCAVGRSSFEIARYSRHVDAIDFSNQFIQSALALQKNQSLNFHVPIEGELSEPREINLEKIQLNEFAHKVHFSQGDACNLKTEFRDYQVVFAGNLIDRLYDPAKFLNDISLRIQPEGYLVLTSPYTWLKEFTEKSKWLGGLKNADGSTLSTLEGISKILTPHFNIVGPPIDIPFVIRETKRKHQYTISQMTIWRKKI